MKINEFCYWLQGLYELQKPTEINEEQLTLIKKHLELVEKTEKVLNGFPLWLKGYLQGLNVGTGTMIALYSGPTKEIENELGNYFRCVIDHSYSTTAEELRKIHGVGGGGFALNC